MQAWKMALKNTGASMGNVEFNILEFFPDQPDEMGLRSKGELPPIAGDGGSQSLF